MKVKPTQISLFDFDSFAEAQPVVNKNIAITESIIESAKATPAAIEPPLSAGLTDEIDTIETGLIPTSSLEERIIDFSTPKPAHTKAINKKPKSTRGRKSIQEMSESVHLVEVPADEILFQKSYYSIGKVAEMFKVNQSLIRLWENEFDVLKPKKNGKGDRFFRPEDVKNIQLIHHLMREKKYTMEGAKEYFKNNKKAAAQFTMIESLKKIKGFLLELKANL